MENVPYIFPACYGIRQNKRKHENFVLPFLLSFRVQRLSSVFLFWRRRWDLAHFAFTRVPRQRFLLIFLEIGCCALSNLRSRVQMQATFSTKKEHTEMVCSFLAEKMGFEPMRRLPDLLPLQGSPFTTWVLLHGKDFKNIKKGGGEEEIRTLGPFRDH